MSGRSYTRTGIQDPRSNQQQKQNPTLPSLSYSSLQILFGMVHGAKAIYHETRPESGLVERWFEGWSSRLHFRIYRSGR